MTGGRQQPALVGGVLAGVLSALPLVSVGNCCCCLWVVTGGLVAAYLLQQNQAGPIDVGDGAMVGLVAGVVGAVVATVLSVPIALMMGPFQARIIERLLQTTTTVPEAMRGLLESWRDSGASAAGTLVGFIFMVFVGVVFSTAGGMLGAVMFRRGRQQAGSMAETQPAPPPL